MSDQRNNIQWYEHLCRIVSWINQPSYVLWNAHAQNISTNRFPPTLTCTVANLSFPQFILQRVLVIQNVQFGTIWILYGWYYLFGPQCVRTKIALRWTTLISKDFPLRTKFWNGVAVGSVHVTFRCRVGVGGRGQRAVIIPPCVLVVIR